MITELAYAARVQPEDDSFTVPTAEREFYGAYNWCLNAYPSMREVVQHLSEELTRYSGAPLGWQRDEIARNIFLLSCMLVDTADDYLLGRRYSFSKVLGVFPFLSPFAKTAQKLLHVAATRNWLFRRQVWSWRVKWESAVVGVLRKLLLGESVDSESTFTIAEMQRLLSAVPAVVCSRHPRIPAAFRSQDLTHFDVLSLGEKFITAFPDRNRPILVTGLRTAGSYFALLLRAYLESRGYSRVQCVTLRPKAGVSQWEKERIRRNAGHNCLAVVIDEPVGGGATVSKGISSLMRYGIARDSIIVLFPVHRNGRQWKSSADAEALHAGKVLTLEHEEWYKHRLVGSGASEALLREYFQSNGWAVQVEETGAEHANAYLQAVSEEKYHSRLKKVFRVRLDRPGKESTRYVLAKSVGWGWLGYHAFLAGMRLAACVPSVLGLREGILYTEWVPEQPQTPFLQRTEMVNSFAQYVATRARTLQLHAGSTVDTTRESQPTRGLEELSGHLSNAYGKAGGVLKRARIKRELTALQSHAPVLIDSRMRRLEWIAAPGTMLKADFEHHGMGKHQLNVTDPAYDLAETILYWNLSRAEECQLLDEYATLSGDREAASRILLHKILAGRWSMDRALENLNDPKMLPRHLEFNRQYIEAWNFLVLHTMRFCADVCYTPPEVHWSSPLVVLDIDGVIDKQVFGFPSTTKAGIQAISLLHRHGFALAINTARSVREVKEYCQAYHCAGGGAEYGAYVWDALSDRERVLVSDESMQKLDKLRSALRQIPGVFLNDDYRYSIRAYTYDRGRSVPLPAILVQDVIAGAGLDGLAIHHTYTDTTILASETDKGRGMLALLDLAGMKDAKTHAVGDSAPDLPMFRVATHSFAPGQISCRATAELLKCQVASRKYQPGLLECAQAIVRRNSMRVQSEPLTKSNHSPHERYFLRLLEIADQSPTASLLQAVFDPMAMQAFVAE